MMHKGCLLFSLLSMIGIVAIGCSDTAPVAKTGQDTSHVTGDDGDLLKGVVWPIPRFTDNVDGTVTDNLTGLIWDKNANRFNSRIWATAVSDCNGLSAANSSLTDSSVGGDWRLPNRQELVSLLHLGFYNPALPNTSGLGKWAEGDPFTGVQSGIYWSATTHAHDTSYAWSVDFSHSDVYSYNWANNFYVWCVRGGS